MEGLIFGGAEIRREICVSNSARLLLEGKFTSQNRLGYLIVYRKFVSNLHKVFTETRLDDVDLAKSQPCKYLVYMERGIPSQELRVSDANSNIL